MLHYISIPSSYVVSVSEPIQSQYDIIVPDSNPVLIESMFQNSVSFYVVNVTTPNQTQFLCCKMGTVNLVCLIIKESTASFIKPSELSVIIHDTRMRQYSLV